MAIRALCVRGTIVSMSYNVSPPQDKEEEQKPQHDVSDVWENVVEWAENSERMRAVEIIVTNVFITRRMQNLEVREWDRILCGKKCVNF